MKIIKSSLIILTYLVLSSVFSVKTICDDNNIKSLIGMVLLEENNSLNMKETVEELRAKWDLNVVDESGEKASVLNIEGYKFAIFSIDAPIPQDELRETAEITYLWKNAVEESAKHKGHVVIMLMNGGDSQIIENLLFTKVVSAALNNSKSIGLYMGYRSLLLNKELYINASEDISENNLPIILWIYFGVRQHENKQSIYSYGLADFNKLEMEIVNSSYSLVELMELMYDVSHYVLASDVALKDGETIGMSEEQKLKISISKGVHLEGTTIKIGY